MNGEKMSIHDYPSLASFVRRRRMVHRSDLSVRKASIAAGWPESTWGSIENGRLPRPGFQKLHAVAGIIKVRAWPLAIIAGIRPVSRLNRLGGLIMESLPQSDWWNIRGAQFVSRARQQAGRNYDQVVARWRTEWPLVSELDSIDPWKHLESRGILPRLPSAPKSSRQPSPSNNFAQLSGAWWFAILDAAVGDPELAFYLLPGLAFVMGEAHPEIARKADETLAWERLVESYRACYTTKPEAFNDATYFESALTVARNMMSTANTETGSQKLARIAEKWSRLTPNQQDHVVSIVEDLGRE